MSENAKTTSEGGHAVPGESPGKSGSSPARTSVAKNIVGTVSSDRMKKTRAVQVQRLVKHPKYGKYVRHRSTFYAHDEEEVSHAGDTVLIAETRPLSKLKRWRLVKVIAKAAGVPLETGEEEAGLLADEAGSEPAPSPDPEAGSSSEQEGGGSQ